MADRFHLEAWERSIQRRLEVVEGIYQVLSDQTTIYRAEFMEMVVIVLILIELLVAVFMMR